jgi:hypothetical protein
MELAANRIVKCEMSILRIIPVLGCRYSHCRARNCPGAESEARIAPPRGKFCDKTRTTKEENGEVKSYLLELLNGTLVNTTALVDQVTYIGCEMDTRCLDGGAMSAHRWLWTCQNRRGR